MLCFGASGARGRVPSSAGWDGGGAAGGTAARPMYPSCSASLYVCLHRLPVVCNRSTSSSSCRRRPMLVPSTGVQALPAMHRELGADSAVGGKGRPVRRQRARCTRHLCSASLCVCLHHRCSVACSFQPATACDRSGARDRSSHRRGGEAMAAAAYPGSRLQPVLGVRDASGARGGFCRRRGRAADATAARPMHAAPMQC